MNGSFKSLAITFVLASLAALPILAQDAPSNAPPTFPEESVLYSFQNNGVDGNAPTGSLTLEPGNQQFKKLYGTTRFGGVYGEGIAFELSPTSNGWVQKVLHNFGNTGDGKVPANGMIFDKAGNLYGTTAYGGGGGVGTVFELSPLPDGSWTETILHSFLGSAQADGSDPFAGVILDKAGNLYGTTFAGGNTACGNGCGTVFELSPQPDGSWTETVLHNFVKNNSDGVFPGAGLAFDSLGNLYGTTKFGGSSGQGVVFELTPQFGGVLETIIHNFSDAGGKDGSSPEEADLILDRSGRMYGTTPAGGSGGNGTVFELSLLNGGQWREKIIHNFPASGKDGKKPLAGLLFDASGNLYGSTSEGGPGGGRGTVFSLLSKFDGGWIFEVIHEFPENPSDGSNPHASLIFQRGYLLGTTATGGDHSGCLFGACGTVFAIRLR